MGEAIRVLQVVTQMHRAGLETMLMNYYRHIDRSKVQFDFLTHREGHFDYDDEIRSLGGRIYPMCPIRIKNFISYRNKLDSFFRTHPEYKIIHCHLDSLSTFVLLAAKKAGVPIRIAHSHNSGFERDIKMPFRYLSRLILPFSATHFMGCGNESVRFMFGKKIYRSGNYTIIQNAIDVCKFSFDPIVREEYRSQMGLNDKLVFGHIGRFTSQKNHTFLIDIFEQIYSQRPDSALLLIGTGDNEQAIREKVRAKRLNSAVYFLGVREDIPQLLNAMDVFLLPSLFEGLPVVGVEAQAAGLPCFFSDRVPQEVQITGNVVFLPLGDASLWVQAILSTVISRESDIKSITAAGFDVLSQAKELEKLYCNYYSIVN